MSSLTSHRLHSAVCFVLISLISRYDGHTAVPLVFFDSSSTSSSPSLLRSTFSAQKEDMAVTEEERLMEAAEALAEKLARADAPPQYNGTVRRKRASFKAPQRDDGQPVLPPPPHRGCHRSLPLSRLFNALWCPLGGSKKHGTTATPTKGEIEIAEERKRGKSRESRAAESGDF